jgi:hypothetical protein
VSGMYVFFAIKSFTQHNLPHTYHITHHSRLIPEGEAELSQIFFRDAHVLPK